MEIVNITGTARAATGKKSTKSVRKEGKVPCVIYGGGKNIHFSAEQLAFRDLIYTPDFKIAEVNVDGSIYKCILKDMQFHPVTEAIQHLDFVQLVDGKKVVVEIPVRFKGDAPGVKIGGKLTPTVRRVKIKTEPANITEALYVDISHLDLGHAVRVKDIELAEGMEIMNNSSIPVATIEIPRALRSANAGEAGDEDSAEAKEE